MRVRVKQREVISKGDTERARGYSIIIYLSLPCIHIHTCTHTHTCTDTLCDEHTFVQVCAGFAVSLSPPTLPSPPSSLGELNHRRMVRRSSECSPVCITRKSVWSE